MLSEQQICKIVCSNPPACTCTDNCPIRFTIESVHKAVEAQHKRDCEDFQKILKEIEDYLIFYGIYDHRDDDCPQCDEWRELKHKWGMK